MLHKLLQISGPSLGPSPDEFTVARGTFDPSLLEQLRALLSTRNGFYAFESALHVFSTKPQEDEQSLGAWNSDLLWRSDYGGMADGYLFFAEDLFGVQFALGPGGIHQFDPETGEANFFAQGLEAWADLLLSDYNLHTGYSLGHDWQTVNGALKAGQRLLPKLPFVAGGSYSVDNLYTFEAVRGMKYRAALAVQIRDLPDGTPIRFTAVP